MIIIPTFSGSQSFTEDIVLGAQQVSITGKWNTREEAWYLDVSDTEGNHIKGSIKLVANIPTAIHYMDVPFLLAFITINNGSSEDPPTFESLGDSSQLLILEQQDLIDIGF